MASESRPRDSGGTPGRKKTVRRRVEVPEQSGLLAKSNSDDDSESDSTSTSALRVDEEWHVQKSVPFVDIGAVFVVVGDKDQYSFERTYSREARCVRCNFHFGARSYHKQGFLAHGDSCAKKRASGGELCRRNLCLKNGLATFCARMNLQRMAVWAPK